MTTVGVQPISLRNATLTVAEDDYTQSIDQVLFVPQIEYDWFDHLDGTHTPEIRSIRWVAIVGYVQDFTTPGSLSMYLIEHVAFRRTIAFTPVAGSGQKTISADALLVPGQMGGVPGQILAAQVTLPLFDPPVIGEVV